MLCRGEGRGGRGRRGEGGGGEGVHRCIHACLAQVSVCMHTSLQMRPAKGTLRLERSCVCTMSHIPQHMYSIWEGVCTPVAYSPLHMLSFGLLLKAKTVGGKFIGQRHCLGYVFMPQEMCMCVQR